MLRIKEVTGMGRGVFTTTVIKEGRTVEVCPLLTHDGNLEIEKCNILKYHALIEGKHRSAIILGYGSLYNHDFQPNTRTVLDWENRTLTFIATRQIEKGEQITFNYLFSSMQEAEEWGIPTDENIVSCKQCQVININSTETCANCNTVLTGGQIEK